MKSCPHLRILALAAGLGLLASSASSWQREAVLGSGGELYTIKQGLYRELVPDAPQDLADNPVLALEIVKAGEPPVRQIVPGTEDDNVERTPTILFEDSSNTVFLVWESTFNYHPLIKLASFDGERWAPEIEVRGSAFGFKTSPQIAVTRDSYTAEDAEGKPVPVSRTILHLIWEEEDGTGTQTKYVPVILENGQYIGRLPSIELNRLDTSPQADLAYELDPDLVRSPSVQPGRDGRSVVVSFADALSKRLVTVEVGVLPRELARLADKARGVIIDMGARLHYPKNLDSLAEQAREAILAGGGAFQPEVVQALASRIADQIRAAAPSKPLEALAGEARGVIIDMGARLSGPGLRNTTALSRVPPDIRELRSESAPASAMASPSHLLQFRVASSRPGPRVPTGAVTLMSSSSGEDVLIAVVQEGRVLYRDSKADGWNEIGELKLSDRIDLRRAFDILNERIRGR